MIYLVLCWEFFKIGLFAIGGGLVTVPFLFDLAEKYKWFTTAELADMIAISQSTPGPIGINMATFAGYKVGGIYGGIAATLSEVLPAMIIIFMICKILDKWAENPYISRILQGIRPAVLALILYAGWDIAKISLTDYKNAGLFTALLLAMHFYPKSPIFYILLAAGAGIVFQI